MGFLALIGGVVVAAALGLVFARDEAFRTFAPIIRLIFLLWICLTVVVTVLIPLDSFSDENVTILGVAWLGVVALWCLDGLAAARAARSNGDLGSLTTRPGHEA